MSLVVDEHRQYLSDPIRLTAFERAISAVVRPGDVVVDLGSGTGILGMFACRAGARRVHAIEFTGMIEVARALAQANGYADRIVFVQGLSIEVTLPERADVIVSDLIGHMGFEAGLFELYRDARRFMKPDARLVPRSVKMCAAPVEDVEQFEIVRFWSRPCAGFTMAPVMNWARNTGYPRSLSRDALLATECVSTVCPSDSSDALMRLRGDVVIARPGIMHGVGAWFEVDLGGGVMMSNAPSATDRLQRRNVFFPLDCAVRVDAGDRVALHVRVRPTDMVVSWDVEIHAGGVVHRERHSTLDGMLITRQAVRVGTPESNPQLTARGLARQSVLNLCDGQRSLFEIEQEVFRRHRGLFRSIGDAQTFVAEVVTRYTEHHA